MRASPRAVCFDLPRHTPDFALEGSFSPLGAPFREPVEVEPLAGLDLRVRTRLSVDGGPDTVIVHWQVGADPRFRRIERYGLMLAQVAGRYEVRIALSGLSPAFPYWLRMWAGGCWSEPFAFQAPSGEPTRSPSSRLEARAAG